MAVISQVICDFCHAPIARDAEVITVITGRLVGVEAGQAVIQAEDEPEHLHATCFEVEEDHPQQELIH